MNTRLVLVPASAAVLFAIAACSSASSASLPVSAPSSTAPTVPSASVPAPSASPSPVSAVPGSNDNEYIAGPFTVELKGIGALPTQYDAVNQQGQTVPENCAVVDVKDTSASFRGWVAPDIEFVKGHSLAGQVLGTAAADPSGGSSGGESDTLIPGQSETLYACPSGISNPTYVEAQLISVEYGEPGVGTLNGTMIRLRY